MQSRWLGEASGAGCSHADWRPHVVDQSVGTNKHRTEDDTSDTMPGGEKRMEKEKATKMGLLMACSS